MLREKIESYANAGLENRFWYEKSYSNLAKWANENGFPVRTVCDICAIFSPRVQVVRNVRLCKQYLLRYRDNNGPLGTMPGAMNQRVIAADRYMQTGQISGVKIKAFADCLSLSNSADPVIDIHMSNMVNYGPDLMSKTKRHENKRKQWQRIIRKWAARLDVTPWQLQAMLWAGYLDKVQGYSEERRGAMEW